MGNEIFDNAAEAYSRYRKGYSDDLFRYMIEHFDIDFRDKN